MVATPNIHSQQHMSFFLFNCLIQMGNLCAQYDTVAEFKHRDMVTCMRVNAICTILQLTLVSPPPPCRSPPQGRRSPTTPWGTVTK